MSLQSAISATMLAGYPGMWYDISDTDAIGHSVEGSIMAFGIAAVQGTHDNQCRVPDAANVLGNDEATTDEDNPFLGIVMQHATKSRTNISTPSFPLTKSRGYLAEYETASLARHGRIWVISETDADRRDPVFFRHTLNDASLTGANQPEQLGGIRNDADTDKATQIVTARYLYSANAGELAVIELTGAR